jgi:putative phosphotransacetylase
MQEKTTISMDKLGIMLTHEKNLSNNQLHEALKIQKEYQKAAIPSRIGEVLVESGACTATVVSEALLKQRDQQVKSNSLGQVLMMLGFVTKSQLEKVMETHMDILAPIGEILIDQGICTRDQIEKALHLQLMRRVSAIRRPMSSNFDPLNIMELLVLEEIEELMNRLDACNCDMCRANIIAVSLNGIAPRYISDIKTLISQIDRYREEYSDFIRERIRKAIEQVKKYPKLSCRNNALKDESDPILGTVKVGLSNRHVHLSEDDIQDLFGHDYELTKWKELSQPGQYAAKETVVLLGPKGSIEKVRVLGPPRSETQVEISGTDQFILGVNAPVRESGMLDDTSEIELLGPEGSLTLEKGVIRAWRHIHMTPGDGRKFNVENREKVNVRLIGDRTTILENVLIRITDTSALEMHIDTDEANAAGIELESKGEVLRRIEKKTL